MKRTKTEQWPPSQRKVELNDTSITSVGAYSILFIFFFVYTTNILLSGITRRSLWIINSDKVVVSYESDREPEPQLEREHNHDLAKQGAVRTCRCYKYYSPQLQFHPSSPLSSLSLSFSLFLCFILCCSLETKAPGGEFERPHTPDTYIH